MTSRTVTQEDVEKNLNFIERMLDEVGSSDEYLSAILMNQKLMAQNMLMGQRAPAPTQSISELPPNTAGIALSDTPADSSGDFLFDVQGYKVVLSGSAGASITKGEVVSVLGSGDTVIPESEVDSAHIFPGSDNAITSFEQDDTDEKVTIEPGEAEKVIEIETDEPIKVWEVGTNDRPSSLYQYIIDGETMLEEPLKQPLGLYNDPYRFPRPIKVVDNFAVLVKRMETADASDDYFSKVTHHK